MGRAMKKAVATMSVLCALLACGRAQAQEDLSKQPSGQKPLASWQAGEAGLRLVCASQAKAAPGLASETDISAANLFADGFWALRLADGSDGEVCYRQQPGEFCRVATATAAQ